MYIAGVGCAPSEQPQGEVSASEEQAVYLLLLRGAPVLAAPKVAAEHEGRCPERSLLQGLDETNVQRPTGGFETFYRVSCNGTSGFLRYGRHTAIGNDHDRLLREEDARSILYDFGVSFSGIYHAGDFEFVLEPKLLTDPDGIPRAVIGRGGIGMTHALRQLSQEQYELSTAPADLRWFEAEGIDADTRITVEALPAGTVRFTGTSQYSLYQRILEIGAFERDPDPAYPDVIE